MTRDPAQVSRSRVKIPGLKSNSQGLEPLKLRAALHGLVLCMCDFLVYFSGLGTTSPEPKGPEWPTLSLLLPRVGAPEVRVTASRRLVRWLPPPSTDGAWTHVKPHDASGHTPAGWRDSESQAEPGRIAAAPAAREEPVGRTPEQVCPRGGAFGRADTDPRGPRCMS